MTVGWTMVTISVVVLSLNFLNMMISNIILIAQKLRNYFQKNRKAKFDIQASKLIESTDLKFND